MEIDIPNLSDVAFVETCSVCYGSGLSSGFRAKKDETCYFCEGSKVRLTPVGERFIEFLGLLGIHIPKPEGWKDFR